MEQERFPPDDRLLESAKAYNAMHDLTFTVHCLRCKWQTSGNRCNPPLRAVQDISNSMRYDARKEGAADTPRGSGATSFLVVVSQCRVIKRGAPIRLHSLDLRPSAPFIRTLPA